MHNVLLISILLHYPYIPDNSCIASLLCTGQNRLKFQAFLPPILEIKLTLFSFFSCTVLLYFVRDIQGKDYG